MPGTSISFGSVDEPVGAPGSADDNAFLISGTHGNPQEGGTLFTATDGQFTTAGGGAGPGDALVVFGKAVEGNSDLVSAVTVASVTSQTSLNVSSPFNRNDTTGTSVDYGAVLPYLIGRSQHGNISSPATTNAIGVAHTTLNYTVNSVGDAVAIWAQADGVDNVTGGQRRVTDAGTLVYPGVGPATMLVSPLTIAGNTTANVTVCVTDALGIPLRGVQVGYLFSLAAGGTGSVDGGGNTGTFDHLTGLDGCAVGAATTQNVPGGSAGGTAGTLTVSAAGQSQDITITAPVVRTLTIIVNATTASDPPGALPGLAGEQRLLAAGTGRRRVHRDHRDGRQHGDEHLHVHVHGRRDRIAERRRPRRRDVYGLDRRLHEWDNGEHQRHHDRRRQLYGDLVIPAST